jgi:quercetin dioxygenase-like cupin family protein
MLKIGGRSVFVAVAACVASACSTAAPSPTPPAIATANSPVADGWTNKTVAEGSITGRPTGPLHIEVVSLQQEPGRTVEHAHVGGFVFALSGVHRLTVPGVATRDLSPGEAAFVPQDAVHTHANPGTSPDQWYYVAIRNTAEGSTSPGPNVVYESPDLPTFPAGKYNERLNLGTLERGGRGFAHRHPGVEVFLVLDGTVQLRVAGQSPKTLTKGKGAYVPPNVVMQSTNTGDGIARFLTFIVAPDGVEDTTLADTAP